MRKLIGSCKGQDIFIFELHIADTYDGVLCGEIYSNKRIIDITIPKQCKIYFPEDVPLHIAGKETLDLGERLPDDIVYAHIGTCCPNCGNYLNLVWFQEPDMDPYAEAQKHLREVDWGKESLEGSA